MGVEPPFEVVSPLSLGVLTGWVVGALDVILLRVEALGVGTSC